MREKGKGKVQFSSSSSSSSTTDENVVSENGSNAVKIPLKKKEIKISVHGVSKSPGGGVSHRPALRALQPNKLDSRVLLGQKSPRKTPVSKGKQLKQCVLSCTSPLSSKSSEKQSESDESRMKTTEQCTQTEVDATISLDDRMITQKEPPPEYWKILAESRRLALAETLKENEELYTMVSGLKKRVNELEIATSDMKYFAMMYTLASKEDSEL